MGNLNKLSAIDLSANNLSGEIPSTIGGCSSLEFLNLQRNFFHGSIPTSLSSLKGLSHLDISQNNLSGEIPKELQTFLFLVYMNISYNGVEGEVPKGGVFKNTSAVFLSGNIKLFGGVPNLYLHACPTKVINREKKFLVLKLTIIVVSVVLLFLSISIFLAYYCRRKSVDKSISTMSSIEFLSKVTYRALFNATNGISK